MRTIKSKEISDVVYQLCYDASHIIDKKVLSFLKKAMSEETSENAKEIISEIILNDEIAEEKSIPMCQDTGIVVAFLEIGYDVHIDGDIYDAINAGVSKAYNDFYLRKSVVISPFERKNTNDNTPAIIHIKMVPGDKIKISIVPKGAGSENMSKVVMLNPSDGIEGIKKFIVKTVVDAGGKACPPIILGIGIGGDLEKCALMAKEALLRDIDDKNPDPVLNNLETEILNLVNETNIGPMGLHGKTTCLAVKIKTYSCHIASLPLAVNIQCHASRHKEAII